MAAADLARLAPGPGCTALLHPAEPNFVGSGLPHVGPWGYVQDVPMLWYGPGYIPAQRRREATGHARRHRPHRRRSSCTSTFHPIDGSPMSEALMPGPAPTPPSSWSRWSGTPAAANVLNARPNYVALPEVADPPGHVVRRTPRVGSSPTCTAQDHATIGTGDFPDHHGIVGHHLRDRRHAHLARGRTGRRS